MIASELTNDHTPNHTTSCVNTQTCSDGDIMQTHPCTVLLIAHSLCSGSRREEVSEALNKLLCVLYVVMMEWLATWSQTHLIHQWHTIHYQVHTTPKPCRKHKNTQIVKTWRKHWGSDSEWEKNQYCRCEHIMPRTTSPRWDQGLISPLPDLTHPVRSCYFGD